ncbi:MAG: hypothetical protein QM775_27865 [Pirellulales bacterium]
MRLHLGPPQPFGLKKDGGRTSVCAVATRLHFNTNNGYYFAEPETGLNPLEVAIEGPHGKTTLRGSTLIVEMTIESLQELEKWLFTYYFGVPVLLNVSFADAPFVERVDGDIGGVPFEWWLRSVKCELHPKTQEEQEKDCGTALARLSDLELHRRTRVVAVLHYFHVACRLVRAGVVAGEFVAESILNFSKSLEVLFPPDGDGKTREAIRVGLQTLGVSEEDIELKYMPAVALRNEIDVGHAELGLFTKSQLRTLHQYVEDAEKSFRFLFATLLQKLESGTFDVLDYDLSKQRRQSVSVIDRLEKAYREAQNSERQSS